MKMSVEKVKDWVVGFYSPLVDLRLQQITQAEQHLEYVQQSALRSIVKVSKKRVEAVDELLYAEGEFWDDKIEDANLVLEICKRDFYQQIRHESVPFCGFMLVLGVLVFLQW